MFSDEEIMTMRIGVVTTDSPGSGKSKTLVSVSGVGGDEFKPLCASDCMNVEFFNLAVAAPFMYQTIKANQDILEMLIETCEKLGNDSLAGVLMKMQSSCDVARKLALKGIEGLNI